LIAGFKHIKPSRLIREDDHPERKHWESFGGHGNSLKVKYL